ncbi:NAD(P)/FAD-dependent oxidoreductase [Streptomyces sp. NPDC047108]|uniref:FAD/NAD(P)-dependent oxidoreductase n=1 Tax=Streptomyces sp. NPDC047108 TaxID=3155025 RepID=UPI0033C0AC0F
MTWGGAVTGGGAVIVVGAGPAGTAAALAAADAGAPVVLLDNAPRAGGQYDRQALTGRRRISRREEALDAHPRIDHRPRTSVWALEPGGPDGMLVHVQQGPADAARPVRTLRASALILCTGAYNRALPFPGWDLPGVVTAGAAQALVKGQGITPGGRTLLSGTGPFLLPVASALLSAGADVAGVYEAGSPTGWLRSPLTALRDGRSKLPELAAHTARLARHRVPYRVRTAVVAAHGRDRVESVTLARLGPDWTVRGSRRVAADTVCVGYGFTPQLELAVAAGCVVGDGGFVAVDAHQATSVPGVYAAGEITGIGGAELAAAEGEVAGAAAAHGLAVGAPAASPGRSARRAAARVSSGRRFAAALAAAHPVRPGWRSWLTDDTLVCRCEEVSYGELRAAVEDRGADGMRALKLTSRAGLGACQGRVCGRAAAELAGVPESHRRPIAQPVRLGDLGEAGGFGDLSEQGEPDDLGDVDDVVPPGCRDRPGPE